MLDNLVSAGVQLVKDSSDSFLGSGVILTSLIGLGASLRQVPNDVSNLIYSRAVYSLEVENNSIIYNYVTLWLKNQTPIFQPRSVKCKYNLNHNTASSNKEEEGGSLRKYLRNGLSESKDSKNKGEDTVDFVASPGSSIYFLYRNTLCWYSITSDPINITNASSDKSGIVDSLYREKIKLNILKGSESFAQHIINDAIANYKKVSEEEKSVDVYTHTDYGEWNYSSKKIKSPRTFTNLSLPSYINSELVEDLDKFISNRDMYKKRGIKYRRGYLFYGPPGTGKSSLVEAMADRHGYDINVLTLRGLEDSDISTLLNDTPANRLLLLEDIDSIYEGKQLKEGKSPKEYPSYEFLLNALSGISSIEDIIFVVTTNNIDSLDEALLRPGRIDKKIYLGYVDEAQVRDMFYKFMFKDYTNPSDTDKQEADQFISTLISTYKSLITVTPAMVTNSLIENYIDL